MTVEVDMGGIVALLNEPESLAVLDTAAQAIEAQAQSMTKRGTNPAMGHIADRYFTEKAKPTADGGESAVANSSPVFHLYQFGSANQPPARVVERAIRGAGYTPEQVNR